MLSHTQSDNQLYLTRCGLGRYFTRLKTASPTHQDGLYRSILLCCKLKMAVECHFLHFQVGEIQTMLCLTFGADDVTYSGTLGGDVYVWKGNNLSRVVPAAHQVRNLCVCLFVCVSTCVDIRASATTVS